jgi:hypothetical protein
MENLKNWLSPELGKKKSENLQETQEEVKAVEEKHEEVEGKTEEHLHTGFVDKDGKFHCNWCDYVKD